jgi:hypothetical protein
MLVAGGSSARLLDEARIAFAPVDRDEPGDRLGFLVPGDMRAQG